MARHMSDLKRRELNLRAALERARDYIATINIAPSDAAIFREQETLLKRLDNVLADRDDL